MWCICIKENYQPPYKLPLPSHRTPECTRGVLHARWIISPFCHWGFICTGEENMETLSSAPWLTLEMRCENLFGVSLWKKVERKLVSLCCAHHSHNYHEIAAMWVHRCVHKASHKLGRKRTWFRDPCYWWSLKRTTFIFYCVHCRGGKPWCMCKRAAWGMIWLFHQVVLNWTQTVRLGSKHFTYWAI